MLPQRSATRSEPALAPGVRLRACDDDALALSAGIAYARRCYPELPYRARAFVPVPQWRPPSPAERALLVGAAVSPAPGGWLQLLAVPAAVLAPLAELQRRSATMTERAQLHDFAAGAAGRRALAGLLAYAATLAPPGAPLEAAQLFGNAPDLPTTTMVESERLHGLHVDNWSHAPLTSRRRAPNRLAVNLGISDRYFLYVNLTLAQLARRLGFRGDVRESTTELREAFMRAEPRYPVVRLRVRPGEALLAPTENLIHDGCTSGHAGFDVRFSVRGRFPPQPYCER